jgi:hypothetical protein
VAATSRRERRRRRILVPDGRDRLVVHAQGCKRVERDFQMIDKGVGNGRMATPFSDAADVPDLLEPHQVRETARDQLGLSLRPCGKVSGHNVFEDLDQCRVELVRRFRDKGRQIRAESLIQGHRLDVAVFGCGYSPEDLFPGPGSRSWARPGYQGRPMLSETRVSVLCGLDGLWFLPSSTMSSGSGSKSISSDISRHSPDAGS